MESFGWSVPVERLAWTFVEVLGDALQFGGRVAGEVGAFREVLAQETVRVFVASALPGAAWITEADSIGRRNTLIRRYSMVRRQQAADKAIRPKLRSPGHPKFQRPVEAAFWGHMAAGLLAEEAALLVGVAPAVGARWFRHAGGMAPFDITQQPTGRYLSFAEREEIALLKAQGKGVREIARSIGRDAGTISRELRRNAETRGGKVEY